MPLTRMIGFATLLEQIGEVANAMKKLSQHQLVVVRNINSFPEK